MNTKTIIKSIVAAVLLSSSATIIMAQTATPACPLGHAPGYGRSLTVAQKAEQCAAVQKMVAELRQKQAKGSLTAEEQTWLKQVEQRGGRCVTGTPRGPGAGKGQGAGRGAGQGRGQGLRDGTGPRGADGTCPLGSSPQRGGPR
jgi:hypothetical protein